MVKENKIKLIADLFGLNVKDFYLLIRNPDIFYCTYKIPKRSGGYRVISSPSLKLMNIQRAILNQLLKPKFNPLSCCIGFVEDKSILDNVIPHLNRDYVFKSDIKDFFPSITIQSVQRLFINLGYSHKISSILAKLCCKNSCLPQGAPTSPIISNMIMYEIDAIIVDVCKKYNFIYTRYADDITISSIEPISDNFREIISNIFLRYNLSLNPKKTHLYGPKNKKIITGISISSGIPKLPRKTKRMWRQEINMIEKFGLIEHMEKTQQNNPLYIPSLKGKLFFWKQIEPQNKFIDRAFTILDDAVKKLKL